MTWKTKFELIVSFPYTSQTPFLHRRYCQYSLFNKYKKMAETFSYNGVDYLLEEFVLRDRKTKSGKISRRPIRTNGTTYSSLVENGFKSEIVEGIPIMMKDGKTYDEPVKNDLSAIASNLKDVVNSQKEEIKSLKETVEKQTESFEKMITVVKTMAVKFDNMVREYNNLAATIEDNC